MNILCISKYASPPKYGVGARLFYLAKNWVKAGHVVTLLTSNSNHLANYPETNASPNEEVIDGVRFIWFANSKYKNTASFARVWSWFSFEKSLFMLPRKQLARPDVIVVSSLSLLSIVYGYYLKRTFRVPLIFEVRDIWPLTLTEEGGFARYHPLVLFLGFVERFGYRNSDLIVGTMPKLELHVRQVIGGSPSCFCSPLGFDLEVMSDRATKKYLDLDSYFPKGKTIIGYAGSMGISNNLDDFVQTIKAMSDNKSVHFVLVGSGDKRKDFEVYLNGADNVTFVPRISPDKVLDFLARCDILYLSTHDSEVWRYGQSMNKVVEYMYAGKAIVASYSGYPSMIDESGAGVFVKPGNRSALQAQLATYAAMSKSDLDEIGARGKRWILENRDYSVLAQNYLNRMERLLNRGGS